MNNERLKVYVAGCLPEREKAKTMADWFRRADQRVPHAVEVVSTWHQDVGATVANEAAMDEVMQRRIAEQCFSEVESVDVLCLVFPSEPKRYGSIIETGYALGLRKHVVVWVDAGMDVPILLKSRCLIEPFADFRSRFFRISPILRRY